MDLTSGTNLYPLKISGLFISYDTAEQTKCVNNIAFHLQADLLNGTLISVPEFCHYGGSICGFVLHCAFGSHLLL